MGKLLNKKSIPIVVLCCAAFVCLAEFISLIIGFDESAAALMNVLPTFWTFGTMFLLAWGIFKGQENMFKLGLLLASPFVVQAFVSGFSQMYYMILSEYFEFSVSYGLYTLFNAFALLAVAAGFVLWALDKFFGIKTSSMIVDVLFIVASVLFLVCFILLIVAHSSDGLGVTIDIYVSAFTSIAYSLIFLCEYYRTNDGEVVEQ